MITTVISFLVVLGILVFVHELGHYLAARHVGVRVETFSIGFPPRAWGKKVGDTEYIISWLPLGGYVKLFGQNMDDEDRNDPTNYAAKSILQRFYILVAGPLMNLLFAFIFMPLVFMSGVDMPKYLLDPPIIFEVLEEGFAADAGLQAGDELVALNGINVQTWEQTLTQLQQITSDNISMEVQRGGVSKTLVGSAEELRKNGHGWRAQIDPVIGAFSDGSAAKEAGLEVGDRFVSLNGIEVAHWGDISQAIRDIHGLTSEGTVEGKESASIPEAQAIQVVYDRDGSQLSTEFTPIYNNEAKVFLLGVSIQNVKETFGIVESVEKGSQRLVFLFTSTMQFIGKLFAGQGSMDDLGGPIRIAQATGDAVRSGPANIFFLMAFISLQLGIFNLLPIPALDGGHIFFLIVEKIKGSPLSQRLREKTQMAGFAILMFFMIAVTYNDILQF